MLFYFLSYICTLNRKPNNSKNSNIMKIFNFSARGLMTISASALFLTFGSFAVTSCNNDDVSPKENNNEGSPEENSGSNSSVTKKGYKLTQVGEFTFAYTENGDIASASCYGKPVFSFDKNQNIVMSTENTSMTAEVSYDSKGRIVNATAKESYNFGDESGAANVTIKASYNGDYITSLKCVISDEWSSKNGKHSQEATYETTFNWTNGLINKFSTAWSVKENGSSDESGNYETVYTYDNHDAANKLQQPFISMFDELDYVEELAQPLGVLGFFGNGPVTLPTSFTSNYYADGQETETTNLRYTFNEDGTIRTEHKTTSWGWEETIDYVYAGNATRSIAGKQQSDKRFVITPLHLRKR